MQIHTKLLSFSLCLGFVVSLRTLLQKLASGSAENQRDASIYVYLISCLFLLLWFGFHFWFLQCMK
ncbi:hypothetical protein RchiOBHm_Chr4g0414871 [Rosa chinensis]|uniref:Uncharacterized protein n=1 Tax=Rosa chinensis TaxID=74649 RepID=A0A2P6QWH1_ROSCH|nr:hypothetical protein RchiOBHm_Chr4g0414871 [Rosa chinensis]